MENPQKFVDWGPVMAPIDPVNPVMLGGVPRGLVQVHSAPIAAEFVAADLPDSCALATLGRSWLAPPLAALARRRRPWDVFLVWPSRRARPPPCRPSFRVTRDYKESLCRASYLLLVFAVFDDIGNVELYNTCRVQLDRWWRSSFPL